MRGIRRRRYYGRWASHMGLKGGGGGRCGGGLEDRRLLRYRRETIVYNGCPGFYFIYTIRY